MRTVSAQHRKGEEPRRSWRDNLRLLGCIGRGAFDYWLRGASIRRKFRRRRRDRRKLYIEDLRP